MNRSLRILLQATSWLGFASMCLSQPAINNDPCACQGSNPDHLIPVSFDSELEYRALLIQKLFLSTAEYGRAVIMPSAASEGESSVGVYSSGGAQPEVRVAYAKAERNIWYAQSESNPNRSHEPPVKVSHIETSIPGSTAVAIRRAWKQMLCQTRPSVRTGNERVVVDATDVEFSLVDREGEALYGRSPQERGKNTEDLYQLVKLLVSYCEAEPSKRFTMAQKIENDANGLIARIQAEKGRSEKGK